MAFKATISHLKPLAACCIVYWFSYSNPAFANDMPFIEPRLRIQQALDELRQERKEGWAKTEACIEELRRVKEELANASSEFANPERAAVLKNEAAKINARCDELAQVSETLKRAEKKEKDRLLLFPSSKNRIAVIPYEQDEDESQLADDISFLIAEHVLFHTVGHRTVISYTQTSSDKLRKSFKYFDLVDQLTRYQNIDLALWGKISVTEEGITVDSYLQIPQDEEGQRRVFDADVKLKNFDETLRVSIRPDRVHLQKLVINAGEAREISAEVEQIRNLRESEGNEARIVGRISGDKKYWVVDVHETRYETWVRLKSDAGDIGWTSVDAFCSGICSRLLNVASFASKILELNSQAESGIYISDYYLEDSAKEFAHQAAALAFLRRGNFAEAARSVASDLGIQVPDSWLSMSARDTQKMFGSKLDLKSVNSANFANIFSIARLGYETRNKRVSRPQLVGIAKILVQASLLDPSNQAVSKNLKTVAIRAVKPGDAQKVAGIFDQSGGASSEECSASEGAWCPRQAQEQQQKGLEQQHLQLQKQAQEQQQKDLEQRQAQQKALEQQHLQQQKQAQEQQQKALEQRQQQQKALEQQQHLHQQ